MFRILQLDANNGLICALEEGLKLCSYDFIARLDADDLLEDHRLSKQKAFLEHNQDIHVVGSQAVQICSDYAQPSRLIKGMPTHPVMIAWEMMFRCSVLHPSVMFRRSVIQDCGSYELSTNSSAIEDYDLWCRTLRKYPFSIGNLPDVLIRLRKHEASKSTRDISRVLVQSGNLRCSVVSELLGESFIFDQSHLDALTQPERFLTEGSLVAPALRLLDAMFEAFLRQSLPDDKDRVKSYDDEDMKLMLQSALRKSKMDKQERLCAVAIQRGIAGDMPQELREMRHRAELRALKAQIAALSI